ncbi:MAG: hypothetical protein RMJ84_07170 [Sandaracinaceae bacterium]|nr:hypothetical protein [Sandaracinaceae bacterium]
MRLGQARPWALGVSMALAGCATLATPGASPEGLPHNGTGPFRDLESEETGLAIGGVAIFLSAASAESGMVAQDGALWYAAAPLEDPSRPPIPSRFPEPNWAAHGPRRIFRAEPKVVPGLAHVSRGPAFEGEREVLRALHPWEGGHVSDPWVLIEPGRVLLYYAAQGGIGLAQAPSPEGPFSSQSEPLLAGEGLRRPSVVDVRELPQTPARYLMYYENNGRIALAASQDGLRFEPIADLSLAPMPPRDERDGEEVEQGAPGAVLFRSPGGRAFIRLYYESRRSNGQVLITLAASADGLNFQNFGRPVVLQANRRAPAPFIVDERISLLYMWRPFSIARSQGTIGVGIAPSTVRLAPKRMEE